MNYEIIHDKQRLLDSIEWLGNHNEIHSMAWGGADRYCRHAAYDAIIRSVKAGVKKSITIGYLKEVWGEFKDTNEDDEPCDPFEDS